MSATASSCRLLSKAAYIPCAFVFSLATAVHALTFNPTTYAGASGPWAISTGDVNGDSHQDMLVTNYTGGSVSVRLGNGTGTFGPRSDFPTQLNPVSVAIGDVNGDARPDLVVANWGSASFSVLAGNGAGGFGAPVSQASGSRPISGRLALLNNDSYLDVAILERNGGFVRVNLGDGSGGFGPATNYATGNFPYSLAIADLNADGHPDAAAANNTSGTTVSILLGNGIGGFNPKTDYTAGGEPVSVAVGDLNGDTKPDLVVANSTSNTVSVLLGNGNGTFAAKTDYPTGAKPFCVAIGDLDLDSRLDVAVVNQNSNSFSVLTGNGNGTLNPKVDFATGSVPVQVAILDANEDGENDLAITETAANTVTVFMNGTIPPVAVPSPANSTCPAAALFGSTGACCFDVTLRDQNNNPIPGSTVNVDFLPCLLNFCPVQPPGQVVNGHAVQAITNAAGVAHFCVCADPAPPCNAIISAEGIVLCVVPANQCGGFQPADSCVADGWNTYAVNGPPARSATAMVADDQRGSILLFGGQNAAGGDLNDMWEWDGEVWNGPTIGGPYIRHGHAMAYDHIRDCVVLFGGRVAGAWSQDTWEWSSSTGWVMKSNSGPSPREGHVMSYDEVTHRVLLFGGYYGNGGNTLYGDTWAWNGFTWTQVANSGPQARMFAAMATDPERQRVVLFGGSTSASATSAVDDTWEWDGAQWTNVALSGPGPRWRHAMAFSRTCARMILTGGEKPDGSPSATTYSWDGYGWRPDGAGLNTAGHTMAYDVTRSRVTAFGGTYGTQLSSLTSALCCMCDDEPVETDAAGGAIFPPTFDPTEPYSFDDVDEDRGDISVLYPGYHTSADSWLKNFPCPTAVGGTIPPEADNLPIADSLLALGITADPQTIADSTLSWENQIASLYASEVDSLAFAPPVDSGTYSPPAIPYCPPAGGNYVFGGRDIVFIHGLQLSHLFQRMASNPGALVDWEQPHGGQHGYELNPEFYDSGGFYRDIADDNWAGHIEKFLTSRNIKNRYVIIAYPCNDRLEVGIQAILTQINDAMRYGTNVQDPGSGNTAKFGTPSFVIVSHSTGGLASATAMYAAANDANLNAQFIAERCKAHVALAGAFSGSRLATVAIAVCGLLSYASTTNLPWLCPLYQAGMTVFGDGTPPCPIATSVALRSVLVDLVPAYTQAHWGDEVANCNIRTITVTGAHPTLTWPLKHIIQPGFDDGVLTANCTSSNPGTTFLWPSGFIAKGGPIGIRKTYDMGISYTSPIRANLYYHDQVKERLLSSVTSLIPFYVASGPLTYLSPTGMLQSVGLEFTGNGFDPLRRRPKYYSFMSCAGEHFSIRSAKFYPNYRKTFGVDNNIEEARTILESDEPELHARYTTLGPVYYPFDDQPLLTQACTPPVHETVKGRRLNFKIKIYNNKKYPKRGWLWKRHYMRPENMGGLHVCDYVYAHVLKCDAGIDPGCTPSAIGPETGGGGSTAATRPNPSHGATTLAFELERPGPVDVAVYSLDGRLVRRLAARQVLPAGAHQVVWDGKNAAGAAVPSGVYLWKLSAENRTLTRRIVIVH